MHRRLSPIDLNPEAVIKYAPGYNEYLKNKGRILMFH